MEIRTIEPFLHYFESVRERTMRVARTIPADKLEWTYRAGKFTMGDLLRHIAATERYMFAEIVQSKPSRYPGHGKELAAGKENVLAFMEKSHAEAMGIFRGFTDADLQKKVTLPSGTPITTWKWLRSMVEHEVHHRGQIYIYLGMLGVDTPPLYGLTSEQVKAKSLPME